MRATEQIEKTVATVIGGKPDQIRTVLTVLLAGGHMLLEDVPGVGKTQLARAFAAAFDGSVHRIQFTPDLLPSDITGVAMFHQQEQRFTFQPGPVFSNLVIADEINRASPKTQSALLECMAESQVTVDGVTHALPKPFLVIATQNPIDMDGTYALPEAQRDRFMAHVSLGYPDEVAEIAMVRARETGEPLADVRPVIDVEGLQHEMAAVRDVFVHEHVERYVVALARATREHPEVRVGASPRATLQLLGAAKARAYIEGRNWLSPNDVKALARHVLAHRLILKERASIDRARDIVGTILDLVPAPRVVSQ